MSKETINPTKVVISSITDTKFEFEMTYLIEIFEETAESVFSGALSIENLEKFKKFYNL